MYKLVIFDLDGTLIDSVADLATATNRALEMCHFPTHPTDAYRFFVGNGINKLFERALPEGEKSEENILKIRSLFLPYYTEHGTELTRPYDGISRMLDDLQAAGVKIAVASNKYQDATQRFVPYYFPNTKFEVILGQREGIPAKPNPQIVTDILTATGISREETLYVGDTSIDMQTAINAELDAVAVLWGFRPKSELEQFAPRYMVSHPREISDIVLG